MTERHAAQAGSTSRRLTDARLEVCFVNVLGCLGTADVQLTRQIQEILIEPGLQKGKQQCESNHLTARAGDIEISVANHQRWT